MHTVSAGAGEVTATPLRQVLRVPRLVGQKDSGKNTEE